MNWLRRCEPWLAAGGGVLLSLSMPGFGAWPLALVAWIPLFFALERGRGFRCGLLFGATFFAIDMRWVLTVMRFNPLVVPGYLLLVAYLAIPFGLVGWLLTWRADRSRPWIGVLLAPALIVLAEAVRTLGPLGTGFSMLHHALYRVPLLIQPAAVLGSWSVSALLGTINAAAYAAWRWKRARYAIVAVAALGVQSAFWFVPTGLEEDPSALAVAIVSSDVDQEVKLDARNLDRLTERYLALGAAAVEGRPDLVVFPESFLPAYILDLDDLLGRLADLARSGDTHILFGTGDYRDGRIFNATVLVGPEGRVLDTYDMVRPVPFGEYIPGRAILEAIGLGSWARAVLPLDLSRGVAFDPLDGIGTPICFESTFPTAARRFTQAGALLLVIVTNDAWFADSSELRSHFATAVFRAVENRRSVVQAANGGISGVIDPRGRILLETSEEAVSTGSAVMTETSSPYSRSGDVPLVAVAGAVAATLLALRLPRRNKRSGE